MSYTTTIPAGKIDEAELIALVDQIKAVTKVDIKIETQFVLTTDNTDITTMLDCLVSAVPGEAVVRSNGHKAKKAAKPVAAETAKK